MADQHQHNMGQWLALAPWAGGEVGSAALSGAPGSAPPAWDSAALLALVQEGQKRGGF